MERQDSKRMPTLSTEVYESDKLVTTNIRTGAELWKLAKKKVFSVIHIQKSLVHLPSAVFHSFESQRTRIINLPPFMLAKSSSFIEWWSFIKSLVLIYVCIFSPYTLAFKYSHLWSSYSILDISTDLFFLTDILLKFNTAFYNHEHLLVVSRTEIALHYARTWLLFDLVAAVPYELFLSGESRYNMEYHSINIILRIVRLRDLRLFRKSILVLRLLGSLREHQVTKKIENWFLISHKTAKLVSTVIGITICTHAMACFWILAEVLENYSPEVWQVRARIIDLAEMDAYLRALYFAVTTLCSVGYGELTPRTTAEILITIIWMLAAVYFLSFNISSLSCMISEQDYKNNIMDYKMNFVDQYVKSEKLNQRLSRKIKNEIKGKVERFSFGPGDLDEVIAILPIELKYEIAVNMYRGIIKEFPIFHEQDRDFIGNIFPLLYSKILDFGEMVYLENQIASEVYFIQAGQVNFVHGVNHLVFRAVSVGQYFGDFETIYKCKRFFGAVSQKITNLLVMSPDVIARIEQDFPIVWKEFEQLGIKRQKINERALAEIKVISGVNKQGGLSKITVSQLNDKINREASLFKVNCIDYNIDSIRQNEVEAIKVQLKKQRECIYKLMDLL